MRVLGIDPGTYKMGVGIVNAFGDDISLEHFEVLSPKKHDSLAERLYFLYSKLSEIISEVKPTEVAIEEPFAARNVKAAMAIGQAQAIAMVAAAQNGLSVSNYAPSQVKQSVTDYGGSSKEQVQEMVSVLLGIDSLTDSFDASDALAVAICHINASRMIDFQIRG